MFNFFSLVYVFLSSTFLLGAIDAAPSPVDDTGILPSEVSVAVSALLSPVTATIAPPASPSKGIARLSSIFGARPTPTSIYEPAEEIVEAGLTTNNVVDALAFVSGALTGQNSDHNVNPRNPKRPIYPRAEPRDAPYDVTEAGLRGAIYIPSSFQYGRKGAPQPVILVPCTGDTGYTTFVGNYIPLLRGSSIGDPVWLNIPGFLLNDAQTNAEYVAHAINYIYGITSRKVAVIGWSQGNMDTQWAFKYWPSTRSKTADHIAFSPDYHGTVIANAIDQGEPLPPSILQQEYISKFMTTLRSNGGDSAYVPTTTVYSGFFDEIVEPQQGTGASAFLKDARGVGVSNNQVQKTCPGAPAGFSYTHEGTLYNPVRYALVVDALSHGGPGRTGRLDLDSICANHLTPGLDLTDFLLTENTILTAGAAISVYPNKVFAEPVIKIIHSRPLNIHFR